MLAAVAGEQQIQIQTEEALSPTQQQYSPQGSIIQITSLQPAKKRKVDMPISFLRPAWSAAGHCTSQPQGQQQSYVSLEDTRVDCRSQHPVQRCRYHHQPHWRDLDHPCLLFPARVTWSVWCYTHCQPQEAYSAMQVAGGTTVLMAHTTPTQVPIGSGHAVSTLMGWSGGHEEV